MGGQRRLFALGLAPAKLSDARIAVSVQAVPPGKRVKNSKC